ncbi:hypothetical protein [Streptomyces sp. 4F14]|uniref:hypothetical protein n=1 Tax=Streptomyces sp. 4F14 TaxID=3394380 RepID=UPI003A88535E
MSTAEFKSLEVEQDLSLETYVTGEYVTGRSESDTKLRSKAPAKPSPSVRHGLINLYFMDER